MRTLAVLMLACACATVPPAKPEPFIEVARRPESHELPPNPREEKLDFKGDEWVEPAEKGQTLAKAGMLVSESRMARDIVFRARYDELRKFYEADRMVWKTHRDYYEERLLLAQDEIRKLQPTWWDHNKDTVMLVGGVLVGFGLTLGVVEAVYAGK